MINPTHTSDADEPFKAIDREAIRARWKKAKRALSELEVIETLTTEHVLQRPRFKGLEFRFVENLAKDACLARRVRMLARLAWDTLQAADFPAELEGPGDEL